jgi:rfaE bifunctional protein kinase chain/domain
MISFALAIQEEQATPGLALDTILSPARLEWLLSRFRDVRVAVVGDFFLDRYLVTDPSLTEQSLETGLAARRVVARRASAGHAGTVTNNLRALGVGTVYAAGFTGEDGEAYELRAALRSSGVDTRFLVASPDVVTGTYLKPTTIQRPGQAERELERLDIKNRAPLPRALEEALLRQIQELTAPEAGLVDAIVISDQVEERGHGAVTDRVRRALCDAAARRTDLVWLVDSRRRIGEYRHVMLKPNRTEALLGARAAGYGHADALGDSVAAARVLAARAGRTVFLTLAEDGMVVVEPGGNAVPVDALAAPGETDPTGAGDATTAGIVPALARGATPIEAAAVGALVAGLTVRQLGTTGTATPAQVLAAFAKLVG